MSLVKFKNQGLKFFGFQILCNTFSYDKGKMNMFSYDGHIDNQNTNYHVFASKSIHVM